MSVHHPQIRELEYNYITDGIFIGTNHCCQTHFAKKLQKEGIEADISLEENRVDTPFGVKFYIWIPLKNYTAPTQEQFDFGVSVLEKLVARKKKIYVHCQNGHGRAPTLVATYLIKKGKTVRQAIKFIKLKRPTIHLDKTQLESLNKFKNRHAKYVCCLGPFFLVLLGISTVSTAIGIGYYKAYFLALGILFSIVSLIYYLKKKKALICEGCNSSQEEKYRLTSVIF